MSKLVQTLYGDSLRGQLADGETLLLFTRIQEGPNSCCDDFERSVDPSLPDPRSRPMILGFSLLNGGVQWNLARQNLWLHGSSGTGGRGTIGFDLWQLFRSAASEPRLVAVTDRRMLLLNGEGEVVTLRGEVLQDRMTGAVRRPCGFRLLSRCRVEIGFADGSMKALQVGWFRTGAARRLVAALAPAPHPG